MGPSKLLKDHKFEEEYKETGRDNAGHTTFGYTGFPNPALSYSIVYETPNKSIEDYYFWILEELRISQAHNEIIKITDIFSASEQSAFFGSVQQRIGLQQEKVSMFLATIGKMIKEVFQLVREIRILKERLVFYDSAMNPDDKSRISAEIALKGIWVDMVEQGAKNPASVYGMARELQFATLPDLFYSVHPPTPDLVDEYVDKLKPDFNRKVREVLARKLRQYAEWKSATKIEMQTRHDFTLKYLRQHFDIIRMYITWVKPYLRNIRRLELKDNSGSENLINAFEGSMIELEILFKRLPVRALKVGQEIIHNKKFYSVILLHMKYRTKPQMNYSQEYQRGPIHVGSCEISFRAYAWDEKKIQKYLKMKEAEDMDLLKSIDGSVKAAMEALGDELEQYLKEAGEKDINFANELKKNQTEKVKGATMADHIKQLFDPFTSVFKGFSELFGSFGSSNKEKDEFGLTDVEIDQEKSAAKSSAKTAIWQTYKNFKKREGFLAW